jgi:SAM-dependent methyltransferase
MNFDPFAPPAKPAYASDFRALMVSSGYGELTYGTDDEPGSSLRMATLSSAMGPAFCDGMQVLDYGCGAARYAHFLRQRLDRFTYFGFERPGSLVKRGERSIDAAKAIFRDDDRVHVDLIGASLEALAIERANIALLGSVFTHVELDEMRHILTKLMPIVSRKGQIVFTIFLADEHRLEDPGMYGFHDCYGRSFFTTSQLASLASALALRLTESDSYVAQDGNLHRVFRADLLASDAKTGG